MASEKTLRMRAARGAPYFGGRVRKGRLIPLFRYYAKGGGPLVKGVSIVQLEQWRHVPNGAEIRKLLELEFRQRPHLVAQHKGRR